MAEVPPPVIPALLASGFPFQTAVAAVIPQAPGWSVAAEEFPWQDAEGADRFLDLVVKQPPHLLTIECKKTEKENYVFLQPQPSAFPIRRARCVFLTQIRDSTRRMELQFGEWSFLPESIESAFCVVTTSATGKDQRLLERDVQQLVRGTDGYARYHKRGFQHGAEEPDWPYVPVLVTNANLFIAAYDPASVSLESGQFMAPTDPSVSSVDWVRFAKAFGSHGTRDPGVRTVFVVQARALVRFLGEFVHVGAGASEKGRGNFGQ